MNTLQDIPKSQQVYVDESGIDNYIHRPHGRATIGHQVKGFISGKRYQ